MASRESVLDRVRAIQAREHEARHLDLDVPGFGGDLVLRLGPMGIDAMPTGEGVDTTSPRAMWNLAADSLIRGTRDVLLRCDEGLVPINPDRPSRVDRDLMELLGITPPERARQCLVALCAQANDPEVAVTTLAGAYSEWLAGTADEVHEVVLGESAATPG